MEIYTDTMTASTPSFGMPVVAASRASSRPAPSARDRRATCGLVPA